MCSSLYRLAVYAHSRSHTHTHQCSISGRAYGCLRGRQLSLVQEFGMFKYMETTRTFWFSHLSIELKTEYKLVGVVLGLAIYNGVILDLHFPPVVYKKLLNGKPDFQVWYWSTLSDVPLPA